MRGINPRQVVRAVAVARAYREQKRSLPCIARGNPLAIAPIGIPQMFANCGFILIGKSGRFQSRHSAFKITQKMSMDYR